MSAKCHASNGAARLAMANPAASVTVIASYVGSVLPDHCDPNAYPALPPKIKQCGRERPPTLFTILYATKTSGLDPDFDEK